MWNLSGHILVRRWRLSPPRFPPVPLVMAYCILSCFMAIGKWAPFWVTCSPFSQVQSSYILIISFKENWCRFLQIERSNNYSKAVGWRDLRLGGGLWAWAHLPPLQVSYIAERDLLSRKRDTMLLPALSSQKNTTEHLGECVSFRKCALSVGRYSFCHAALGWSVVFYVSLWSPWSPGLHVLFALHCTKRNAWCMTFCFSSWLGEQPPTQVFQ